MNTDIFSSKGFCGFRADAGSRVAVGVVTHHLVRWSDRIQRFGRRSVNAGFAQRPFQDSAIAADARCRIAAMRRRCRLAVTLVTLALHLFAPVGAYASVRPAAGSSDYCTATRSDAQSGNAVLALQRGTSSDSGVPAPRPSHSPHSHCPSCPGAVAVAAIPPSGTSFVVAPRSLDRVPTVAAHAVIAAQPALLPPLRGPPPVPL
jgi:hypothetical protein